MAIRYKTRGIIFKKNDSGESDRVFSVFTEDFGRLDVFAKAIRKSKSKLRGGIDIFLMSEIEFIQGKNKKTLTDASIIEKFISLPCDLEKFKIANSIGQILDNFITGEEKDRGIFDLLKETFYKLDAQSSNREKGVFIYDYFLWNTLSLLGYRPEVQKCNICQQKLNPYNIYFSNREGGIICKKCLRQDVGGKKINSDMVKILRLIFQKEWKVLSRLKIESSSHRLFRQVSNDYYLYILSSHSFKNNMRVGSGVV